VQLGCRALTLHDAVQGAEIPVHLLYPTDAAATPQSFGPHAIDLARDAPAIGNALPLVVISHGDGGSPWGYRGLTTHLVHGGFAVALVEHIGNSRRDNSLAGTPANLANRPRHVRLAIDAAFTDDALGPHLAASSVAVVGHSFGGYTALAVAGGRPWSLPEETPGGAGKPVPVERDARVKAVVLLAPALPWLMIPGALAEVTVPVQVRTAERDDVTSPAFIDHVLRGLSSTTRLDSSCIAGAGHFAFFYPVPPALERTPVGHDPAGFDRAAIQPVLYAEIVAVLRQQPGVSSRVRGGRCRD
jgi:predicted dienelactone hydrolase